MSENETAAMRYITDAIGAVLALRGIETLGSVRASSVGLWPDELKNLTAEEIGRIVEFLPQIRGKRGDQSFIHLLLSKALRIDPDTIRVSINAPGLVHVDQSAQFRLAGGAHVSPLGRGTHLLSDSTLVCGDVHIDATIPPQETAQLIQSGWLERPAADPEAFAPAVKLLCLGDLILPFGTRVVWNLRLEQSHPNVWKLGELALGIDTRL
jgi:hypothetical protein